MGGPDDIPAFEIGATAFFFDFDGTLADIAPEPHLVRVEPEVLDSLALLHRHTGGAVAVVSGREIQQIDHFLSPLMLPAAGVHGVEIRGADGRLEREASDDQAVSEIRDVVEKFVSAHDGLLAEVKHGSIALHYRQRPELQAACLTLAAEVAAQGRFHVLEGKMVVEFKASPLTKGTAIATLMSQKPFRGKRPFFAGDDVTDEHGFAAVNRIEGISLKVGEGDTLANFRVEGVRAFKDWLVRLARQGGADAMTVGEVRVSEGSELS